MDNPSAFPHVEPSNPAFANSNPGMTLRDWFAGQALVGTFNEGTDEAIRQLGQLLGDEDSTSVRARFAYEAADAMLAARAAPRSKGEGE